MLPELMEQGKEARVMQLAIMTIWLAKQSLKLQYTHHLFASILTTPLVARTCTLPSVRHGAFH